MKKVSQKGYLSYSADGYFFKVKPLFRLSLDTVKRSNMYDGAFLRKQLTAALFSSSVLIAILNMYLFLGMNLLEGTLTVSAYNGQRIYQAEK